MSCSFLQNMKRIIKSHAFTLAEVLIVIGIIGMVSEMTIPTLTSSFQRNVTVAQLKEEYSIINQVLYQAAANSGGDLASLFKYPDTPVGSSNETIVTNFVKTNIIPYVKLTKDCGYTTPMDCTGDFEYYLNKDPEAGAYMDRYMIILSNGTSLAFIPDNYLGYWTGIIIIIDLNGSKKPNTFGKDLFEMRYYGNENKLLFFGNDETRDDMLNDSSNGCNKDSSGMFCGALIMLDGWQIAKDYPWE